MKNTDLLYTAMRDFTNTRRENRETFLRTKRSLEDYKGSKKYDEDLAKAMKVRTDADAVAREACNRIVKEAIDAMYKKNNSRSVTPPTDEQIRILTVAKMIQKPTKPMLDSIARSLEGNSLALTALYNIAHEAWKDDPNILERFVTRYDTMATKELSVDDVNSIIKELYKSCGEIMNGTGANRVREMGAARSSKIFGGTYDPDDLPQEEPYLTGQDFYSKTIGGNFDLFSAAVN